MASAIITPAESIWMSGYASRDHPAEGTRTELWAKALALEDAHGTQAILITLDLVGIQRELSLAICNGIMNRHNLSRSQIVLNCSHTHTGPVVGGNLRSMYFFNEDEAEKVDRYTKTLEATIIQLASDAFASKAPATLSYSEGHATFATNRRNNPAQFVAAWRAAGKLKGPVDYSVPVLRVATEDGSLKTVVFGYACHATTLNDYQWSGDYPGYAQQALEEQFNGVTAMFWAGCGADINPLPRRQPALAEQYGRDLAEAVTRTLQGVLIALDPQLTCNYEEIKLWFDQVPTRADLENDLENQNQYIASRAKMLLGKLDQGQRISEPYPYPIGVWEVRQQAELHHARR